MLLSFMPYTSKPPKQKKFRFCKACREEKPRSYALFCKYCQYLKAKWKLDPYQMAKVYSLQAGQCAICRRQPPINRRLAVDHDHRTGAIRGFLCARCNMGLGYMLDSPEVCMAAADYLLQEPCAVAIVTETPRIESKVIGPILYDVLREEVLDTQRKKAEALAERGGVSFAAALSRVQRAYKHGLQVSWVLDSYGPEELGPSTERGPVTQEGTLPFLFRPKPLASMALLNRAPRALSPRVTAGERGRTRAEQDAKAMVMVLSDDSLPTQRSKARALATLRGLSEAAALSRVQRAIAATPTH